MLCGDLGGRSQLPFLEPARSAVLKLTSSLPERLREQLRTKREALKVIMPPSNSLLGHQSMFDQLVEAVSQRRSVRISYRGPLDSEECSSLVHSYQLFFSRRSWYLIGRSSLHRATRTFHLGRISKLEILDDHYKIPRGFSVERYLRNAWHLIPEPGPDRKVVVRFSKMVAQNVAEVGWHKTQRASFNDDGTMDFQVTVSGLKEIAWWILGYGDQAEVIQPAELRRIVAGHVARLMTRYADELRQ